MTERPGIPAVEATVPSMGKKSDTTTSSADSVPRCEPAGHATGEDTRTRAVLRLDLALCMVLAALVVGGLLLLL